MIGSMEHAEVPGIMGLYVQESFCCVTGCCRPFMYSGMEYMVSSMLVYMFAYIYFGVSMS